MRGKSNGNRVKKVDKKVENVNERKLKLWNERGEKWIIWKNVDKEKKIMR